MRKMYVDGWLLYIHFAFHTFIHFMPYCKKFDPERGGGIDTWQNDNYSRWDLIALVHAVLCVNFSLKLPVISLNISLYVSQHKGAVIACPVKKVSSFVQNYMHLATHSKFKIKEEWISDDRVGVPLWLCLCWAGWETSTSMGLFLFTVFVALVPILHKKKTT